MIVQGLTMMRRMFTSSFLALAVAFGSGIFPALATQSVTVPKFRKQPVVIESGIDYLESLRGKKKFLAPGEIDPRFTLALYVNASASGPHAQRMWVLQRNRETGEFELGMWDEKWWQSTRNRRKYGVKSDDVPPFSWLVSTGKKWKGDNRSGPTSLGVFAMDERRGRTQKGWHAQGMIHAMYIDLHYNSGRRSGIAFHGTTPGQYRKLGRIASHGCIRMHQNNALGLLNRMRGKDEILSRDETWGEVPRFWKYQKGGNRYGYVRDGSVLNKKASSKLASARVIDPVTGKPVLTDAASPVPGLTKTGFRALTIIFQD